MRLVAGTLIAGAGLIWALQGAAAQAWLESMLLHHPRVLALALFVFMAPIGWFAVHLYRLGARVRRAQRFPPPGVPVVRDTPILSGAKALSRARWMQALAAMLMVMWLSCGVALFVVLQTVGQRL